MLCYFLWLLLLCFLNFTFTWCCLFCGGPDSRSGDSRSGDSRSGVKTRVDSRSGDLHRVDSRSGDLPRVDSRSGASLLNMNYSR